MNAFRQMASNLAARAMARIRYGRKPTGEEPFVPIEGDILDAIHANVPRPLFQVSSRIVGNKLGFNYSSEGWSIITAFLAEIRRQKAPADLDHLPPVIHEFYARYTPATLADIYGIHDSNSAYFRRKIPGEFLLPWCLRQFVRKAYPRGWHFSGPATPSEIRERAGNILGVYRSIEARGYDPTKYSGRGVDAHPRGFFLRSGDAYRFVILGGNHRAAVLAALGYETIPVTFRGDYPRVIDVAAAADWPQVRQGNLTVGEARRTLLHYFRDGVDVARRLDLWGR